MRRISKTLVILAIGGWVLLPRLGETCGPLIPRAMFVRPHGPDGPMKSFAQGRIGIVLPKWYRAYLVVAYRYFESKPLSRTEQESLLDFWDENHATGQPDSTQDAIARWASTRMRYLPSETPGVIQEFKEMPDVFPVVPNCLASAFDTATATLKDRARRFGAASPELREWIHGQDAVFSNCVGGPKIPAELPVSAAAWLRADRAYQIAAAHFYSYQYEDAAQRFKAIARDNSSPWHTMASYLVARSLVRLASSETAGHSRTYDTTVLAKAEVWLKQIINDPEQKPAQADAEKLLELVRYHLYPDSQRHNLARMLATTGNGGRFGQRLRDYTWLLDRSLDIEPEFPGAESYGPEYQRRKQAWKLQRYTELKPQRADELTDWLMTVQSNVPAAKSHALEEWHNTRSVPWLVAAMFKVDSSDDAVKDLMTVAAEIRTDSPAYLTLAYERARLANEAGDNQLARQVLTNVLAFSNKLPPSALHLFQDEQMMAAENFDDFEGRLWQVPLQLNDDYYPDDPDVGCYDQEGCDLAFYGIVKPPKSAPLLPQFSPAAATLLNTRVPLEVFVRVSQSTSLPDNLRRRIAPAAWARATLLNDPELAKSAADTAIAAQPELRPYAEAYSAAQTPEERQFAAAFAVLHFPGLRPFVDDSYLRTTPFARIDSYRDNWWCGDVGGVAGADNFSKPYLESQGELAEATAAAFFPGFLSAEQKARAAKEWKQMRSMGYATRYLPRIVINWADRHADDPRVPEALHLAVRATRYGCEDEKPNSLSHEAFAILHKKYPNSEWAKKTPFWFE